MRYIFFFLLLLGISCFFFFKQKTAYEIMPSLVGSEMCIRDRGRTVRRHQLRIRQLLKFRVGIVDDAKAVLAWLGTQNQLLEEHNVCLLYTSDAADDLLCVDLGGRRIIKKKK